MKRAAIYARFSTDLQAERSTEDQIALCRAFADREGIEVVETHEDKARSGGSVLGRDGLMQLMARAGAGAFDVVIVEALDRLSRDMEDLSGIHKRLTFAGIEIRAVHEGTVNTVLIGLRGLMGQLFREDNAHKVRRGLAGRVRDGLSAGGRAYGYRPALDRPGELTIEPDEAEAVRRIFSEYIAGRSPRDIAAGLNRDRIPAPRGPKWNASTINGNPQRGSGILHNEIYAGRIVWNKVRMIKDPDTGKRVSRANPESEWQSADVPRLAIVPLDIFEGARARKQSRAKAHPSQQRRPRHLLSGLLRCGGCGAGMASNGKDKNGRIRIRCSAASESGTCPDPKTFYLATVEGAVLSGLKAELRAPEVLSEYVKTYHEERRRLAAASIERRSRAERRIAELDREISRTLDIIGQALGDPVEAANRMKVAAIEKRALIAELAKEPEPPNLIALHPATIARYERQIERLEESLAAGIAAGDGDAAEAMRDLIQTVTVRQDPTHSGGIEVEITGRLNALLGEGAYPDGVRAVWGKMVAGEGLEPPTRGL